MCHLTVKDKIMYSCSLKLQKLEKVRNNQSLFFEHSDHSALHPVKLSSVTLVSISSIPDVYTISLNHNPPFQPSLLQRILRQPIQPIMSLPPHPLRLRRVLPKCLPIRPRAALARRWLPDISSVRDIALDATGAHIHFATVARVPVRGYGGVIGEG